MYDPYPYDEYANNNRNDDREDTGEAGPLVTEIAQSLGHKINFKLKAAQMQESLCINSLYEKIKSYCVNCGGVIANSGLPICILLMSRGLIAIGFGLSVQARVQKLNSEGLV